MKGRELLDLPIEMLEHIFTFTDNHAMLQVHSTSRSLHHHFSIWNRKPIPDRKRYLDEHANRAHSALELAAHSHMNVLLIGNRSIQINVISRPRYFEETDLAIEVLEDDFVHDEYKIRFHSSLSCEYERNHVLNSLKEANVIILCTNNIEDYEMRNKVLNTLLDSNQIWPMTFILKPRQETFARLSGNISDRIIDFDSGSNREWLAKVLIERLLMCASKRRNEIAALPRIDFSI